jgi:hypothetical protein
MRTAWLFGFLAACHDPGHADPTPAPPTGDSGPIDTDSGAGDTDSGPDSGDSGPVDTGPAPLPHAALVIVVDGVRTDELSDTRPSDLTGVPGVEMAANLWATVAPEATTIRALLNTGVTITAPAHAALLVGRPETYANFAMDGTNGAGLYRPELPTLFEEARAQLALGEQDALLLTNTPLLEGLTASLYPEMGEGARWVEVAGADGDAGPPATDTMVLDALRAEIDAGPPRLVVVNLHDVDRAGHFGAEGEYPADVYAADAAVADLWTWIRTAHPDYAASLLFVVTADHGRHRPALEEAWRSHGDACDGCREVPLFVVGGGAAAGAELEGDYTQLDLTPTLAAWLGVTAPWAEGLPLDDALAGLDGVVRSGEIDLATSGSLVATQAWRADRAARSEVHAGGDVVSTPGVFGAEAPTVLAGATSDFASFRELVDETDSRPWVPRCMTRTGTGAWASIGFPSAEVNPYWKAALAEHADRLWAAWPDNPNAAGDDGSVGLAVASWTAEGWSPTVLSTGYFPTDAALVGTVDVLVAAFTTSREDPYSRYTRFVRVVPLAVDEAGAATALPPTDFKLAELLGAGARVEHAALAADGDHVRVAMLGIADTVDIVAAATSANGGRTWSNPVALPEAGSPLLHLAPAWDGTDVVWGALVDGAAELCRARPGDAVADCIDLGSPRLQSFVVHDGVATVVRDAGAAEWETATVRW